MLRILVWHVILFGHKINTAVKMVSLMPKSAIILYVTLKSNILHLSHKQNMLQNISNVSIIKMYRERSERFNKIGSVCTCISIIYDISQLYFVKGHPWMLRIIDVLKSNISNNPYKKRVRSCSTERAKGQLLVV